MKDGNTHPGSTPPDPQSAASDVDRIVEEFELGMGSPERVRCACSRLRDRIVASPSPQEMEDLAPLLPLPGKRIGSILGPLFDFMEEMARRGGDPWPWFESMLSAHDRDRVRRELRKVLDLVDSGSLTVDSRVARFCARQVEKASTPFSDPECLEIVQEIMGGRDLLAVLFLKGKEGPLRRLAARLLDLQGEPPSDDLAIELLGADAHRFLAPYLAYTRATHIDLYRLVPVLGEQPPSLGSLQAAEAVCGERTLRKVVEEFGWGGINMGLQVREWVKVRLGGSFDVLCSPGEARLFDGIEGVSRLERLTLFVGQGALPSSIPERTGGDDSIARFRSYNLCHAEFLSQVLSVAPLTEEKVRRILDLMEGIVSGFQALFSSFAEESAIVIEIYRGLREEILSGLRGDTGRSRISADLSRLVQTFEDPATPGEITTLHGLKRYLHQRGLGLVSRLAGAGRAADRTVGLAVASRERVLASTRCIHYVDFEPEAGARADARIPYPVGVVVDGFTRQILHGQEEFPEARIFCYGNEVHYYLSFVNHPAFLRIDYSPPLNGGMIDLEFYGVSKYELDHHPDPSLRGLSQFFTRLDFDCGVKDTRVKARFDKEKAIGLSGICEKAEALFRLVPYLMTVDRALGGLELSAESRLTAGRGWADFFALWGVLPLKRFLTRDGKGILTAIERGPLGEREVSWSGEGPYRDRFSPLPSDLLRSLRTSLLRMNLENLLLLEDAESRVGGQLALERLLFRPLREAVARGEVLETATGFLPSPPELFQREGGGERFAEILASGRETVADSAALAGLAAPLERILRFRTTGRLNGHEVQAASLPLRGETLDLHVLREGSGMISLAFFSRDEVLYRHRKDPSLPWKSNASLNVHELARDLRLANYFTAGMRSIRGVAPQEAEAILDRFRKKNRVNRSLPLHGERIIPGLKASPGRAVGRVIFGIENRSPKELEGAILVAPSIRPQDGPFLYHAAGVVSTGGGILSHAGLIALQLGKPSLIVSGEWRKASQGPEFLYHTSEHREEDKWVRGYRVTSISETVEREHRMREGDLTVIDGEEGSLRVLGQERAALAFHEAFGSLGEVTRKLNRETDPRAILILRGHRLRLRRQIENLLSTFADPVLARHVVHELILNDFLSCGEEGEKVRLLGLVLSNKAVAEGARRYLLDIFGRLRKDRDALFEKIREQIPSSNSLYEILSLRLRLIRLRQTLEGVSACLTDCGFVSLPVDDFERTGIEGIVRNRLESMRSELVKEVECGAAPEPDGLLRHRVCRIERLDRVLGTPPRDRRVFEIRKEESARYDRCKRDRLAGRLTLGAEDGGLELFPHIGWKAANLAEVERLAGGDSVPPWYAVTNRAFQEVLDSSPDKRAGGSASISLRRHIEGILCTEGLGALEKSLRIRRLWEDVMLPQELIDVVLKAYSRLREGAPDEEAWPYVAVRSSALEEDSEAAVRAGEFDTFLFIRGEKPLIDYIKRGWSGLWTERAIHFRTLLGNGSKAPGGGILVQRIVPSRVSGVLQTANVSQGNLREMVVNAGMGLGEGIVAGIVPADQIVVAKEEEEKPLRFRYVVSDKRHKVVFDSRAGFGTTRVESPLHERLRPALDYVELCDLVRKAERLEVAYGYPLDMEFALEGSSVRVLQVRPVPTFRPVLEETLRDFPLRDIKQQMGAPDA